MPAYGYIVLASGTVAWLAPFLLHKRDAGPANQVDRRARWGMLLIVIAYSLLWQNSFWERSLPAWRSALSILFLVLAALLSWTSVRALGRQWRLDAGLNPDHELVMCGPYRVVRHPIYTSMLCMLCGTGFIVTPLPLLALSLAVFMIGTEIRVRTEEKLLASRFASRFVDYQRRVPAFIPFVKC